VTCCDLPVPLFAREDDYLPDIGRIADDTERTLE
jgi:pyruvate dehydrogenase E1 component beta subunit/2-oxoisovalerate dehydrogenase E1 component